MNLSCARSMALCLLAGVLAGLSGCKSSGVEAAGNGSAAEMSGPPTYNAVYQVEPARLREGNEPANRCPGDSAGAMLERIRHDWQCFACDCRRDGFAGGNGSAAQLHSRHGRPAGSGPEREDLSASRSRHKMVMRAGSRISGWTKLHDVAGRTRWAGIVLEDNIR